MLVVLTTGLSIVLSAASLFFRDVKYLVDITITFAIFFNPVFYQTKMFGRWASGFLLNPIAPLLEGISDVVVRHTAPPLPWVGYSTVCAVAILVVGIAVFQRLVPYFAESV